MPSCRRALSILRLDIAHFLGSRMKFSGGWPYDDKRVRPSNLGKQPDLDHDPIQAGLPGGNFPDDFMELLFRRLHGPVYAADEVIE